MLIDAAAVAKGDADRVKVRVIVSVPSLPSFGARARTLFVSTALEFCGSLAHRITLDDLILAFRFSSRSSLSLSLTQSPPGHVFICVADFPSTYFIWVSDIAH